MLTQGNLLNFSIKAVWQRVSFWTRNSKSITKKYHAFKKDCFLQDPKLKSNSSEHRSSKLMTNLKFSGTFTFKSDQPKYYQPDVSSGAIYYLVLKKSQSQEVWSCYAGDYWASINPTALPTCTLFYIHPCCDNT